VHLQFVNEVVEMGEVSPVIDKTYLLSHAPDAIGYLRAGQARGKIVITF
jgi:NADPH:quinone reductase-like Zn-dependent oxidoreductase